MKKVLLFSGGFDSTLIALLEKPDVLLYFDINGIYNQREIEHIHSIRHILPKESELIIDYSLNLGLHEKDDDVYVLNRNLLFIATAMNYGNYIQIGLMRTDIAPDMSETFLAQLNDMFSGMVSQRKGKYYNYDKILIEAPAKTLSKSELVEKVLSKYGETYIPIIQRIRSCYSGSSVKGCGYCKPCLQKALALYKNNLFEASLFDEDPSKHAEWWKEKYTQYLPDKKELKILEEFLEKSIFTSEENG
jgi:7-cyano-7-deazaguanine synthase in queuosine biosynthesis